MTNILPPPPDLSAPAAAEPQVYAPPPWQPDDYWANAPIDQLPQLMLERIDAYYEHVDASGLLEQWRRSVCQYYDSDPDDGTNSARVGFGGEQGETVLVNINHYASILNQAHVLVTANRPAAKAQADNTSYDAGEDTMIAEQILEHDLHHKHLEDAMSRVSMISFQQAEGWHAQLWDVMAGKAYGADPTTGQVVYEGDVIDVPLGPLDVVRDVAHPLTPVQDHEWLIIRRQMNRHRLIKQFPELRATIMSLPPVTLETTTEARYRRLRTLGTAATPKTDEVFVFELYHGKNCVVPDGRYALLIGDKIPNGAALPLGYDTIPVHGCIAEYAEESAFGHSPFWKLLGPQTLHNSAVSTMATNLDGYGVNNVWSKPGEVPNVETIGGMNFVQTETRPEPLELLKIPPETFQLAELYQRGMETLSAINPVTRGDPEGVPGKSGSYIAFVDAMAVRSMTNVQRGWARYMERVYSARIGIYKNFAHSKRIARIAGEDEGAAVQAWSSKDLGGVAQVTIKLGNPAMNTTTMRKQMADEYAERGWVQTPEQHTQVIVTGRLEPLFKRDRNEMRLISKEGQAIRRGQPVKALITHRHLLHIREHSAELNSPDALLDDAYAERLFAHIQEHIDMRKAMVSGTPPGPNGELPQPPMPWLLEALGEPLTPSEQMAAQAAMAPPPPMPGPGGGPLPPEAPPDGRAQVPPPMEVMAAVDPAQLPMMPQMPDTGERAQPNGAGGGPV